MSSCSHDDLHLSGTRVMLHGKTTIEITLQCKTCGEHMIWANVPISGEPGVHPLVPQTNTTGEIVRLHYVTQSQRRPGVIDELDDDELPPEIDPKRN